MSEFSDPFHLEPEKFVSPIGVSTVLRSSNMHI
jgi:hypothetical protein